MNFDKTWCSGQRCRKAENCENWVGRVTRWAINNNYSLTDMELSIAQFGDHDGKCDRYEPIEPESTRAGP